MRDSRWNTTALILLRISQLALGAAGVRIAAHFVSKYNYWFIPYTLVVHLSAIVWVAVVISLFFTNKLPPVVAIIADAILAISYIASIASIAARFPNLIGNPCIIVPSSPEDPDQTVSRNCSMFNTGFPILIIQMLTFICAIIWDWIVLHQSRNGKLEDNQVGSQNPMHGGHITAAGGTHDMAEPMINPENRGHGAGRNRAGHTFPPLYLPANPLIYPVRIPPPTAQLSPYTQSYLPPTIPQQGSVMIQHHQYQNHHQDHNHHQQPQVYQIHQAQRGQQQHQLQWQSQNQHQQYQQNRGPPLQELGGTY